MSRFDRLSHIWDDVYTRIEVTKLPWYGLKLPPEALAHLGTLDKRHPLLVTGCGVGDVPQALYEMAFERIIATDISPTAVEIARGRFPHLDFRVVPTELLRGEEFAKSNVFDWMVIHHIDPGGLVDYIKTL